MLRSIKQLHGRKLGASDGDIGHVKDVYFDDETWAIRYVVVDTLRGCSAAVSSLLQTRSGSPIRTVILFS